MRQAWRDTPRVVSSPLPVPSSSSSNEENTDLMFAMSFSEGYDDESDLSPLSDLPGHTLHPDVLFRRARQQSARGGVGSARDGTALYYSSNRKRPLTIQSLYSFPEPSALTNSDPSTSPDSPISGRWPSHSLSSDRHSSASATTHIRRYGPINQSSAGYCRPTTTHSSTDGDEDGEEDDDEDDDAGLSSEISKPYSSRPEALFHSNGGNYPFHIPSTRVDPESTTFKNDHHSIDARNVQYGHSQRGRANDTPRGNDFYATTSHRNNQHGAHIFQPPSQDLFPDPKHSKHARHRSTHDVISYTPRLDFIDSSQNQQPRQQQQQQHQQHQYQQQKLGGVPTITTRPRSNTGGGSGYRLSAPRHPLMSKTTATSYVASSTLVPPGLAASKTDPQNVVTSFASLTIN